MFVAVLAAGCAGDGAGEGGDVGASRRASPTDPTSVETTTTTAAPTTTTVDPAVAAQQALEALTPQERAAFDLLVNPTTYPPPLGPRTAPPATLAPNPVFVLGDSVMLGAQDALPAALPGWTPVVDAQESRLPGRADDVVRARRGEIDRVAVVMLGHNSGPGEDHAANIRAVLSALAGVERVVWVTAAEWGPGQVEFNAALRALAPEHPELLVADWARLNTAHPEYSYDGLHLTPEGRQALAALVAGYVGPVPPA